MAKVYNVHLQSSPSTDIVASDVSKLPDDVQAIVKRKLKERKNEGITNTSTKKVCA